MKTWNFLMALKLKGKSEKCKKATKYHIIINYQ